jgi:circadian clock protein KaiB
MNRRRAYPLHGRRNAAARAANAARGAPASADDEFWYLRLYVAGKTPRAERALANLRLACELHLRGRYTVEVIDLLLEPELASSDQIVALPTLVRRLPPPIKKVIGDLSDRARVAVWLELRGTTRALG